MKKTLKKVAIVIAAAIVMMTIGFGIATAVYSSGMELKIPHIKVSVEWSTIQHDLWLEHVEITDSGNHASDSTIAMK